jgi:hypothetical protein
LFGVLRERDFPGERGNPKSVAAAIRVVEAAAFSQEFPPETLAGFIPL